MGDWEGRPNWYGGQVQQVARVDATSGEWRIIIEPMEQRSSCEFSRFLTSKGLLQVRVPEKLMYGEASIKAREFFSQKFILCGRCFMAFSAKEGKVYMMETNEDFERQSNDRYGDGMRMSFASFVEWFNPLHLNSDQVYPSLISSHRICILNMFDWSDDNKMGRSFRLGSFDFGSCSGVCTREHTLHR